MSVLEPEIGYRVSRDVPIPMRDGVRLAADLYVPDGVGPWPALLTRTPYGKGSVFQSQFILSMQFADAVSSGFVVVVQDSRGRGGSEGSFTPFESEIEDGADTLDWIVAQDFSDGNVAMFGASYVGATQWAAAATSHPALKAIAPVLTSPELREDWMFPGGAFHLAFQLQWAFEALAPVEAQRGGWGADEGRAAALRALGEMRRDPEQAFSRLPLLDDDLIAIAPYLEKWLRHLWDDGAQTRFEPARLIPVLPVPGLHVIGWNDLFAGGGLRAFERAIASDTPSADLQFLIAGPWSHGNMSDWQGDSWYGYDASGEGAGIQGAQLELAKAAVEGRMPDLPRVRYFTTGLDEWRTSEEWPLAGVQTSEIHLSADGALLPVSARQGGAPEQEPVPGLVSFRSDPRDPVPSVGGPSFLPGLLQGRNSGHKDQRAVELREDVVVFSSEPLEDDLHVIGVPRIRLWGSCDREDCDWSVRLCDVDAAGTSRSITDGFARARHRTAITRGLEPGTAVRFDIDFSPISHLFRAGHRIRLQVAGSNFPRFNLNPHHMVSIAVAGPHDYVEAVQTIAIGSECDTKLLLPVVSGVHAL